MLDWQSPRVWRILALMAFAIYFAFRTRLWFPRYIHVLAIIAFGIGLFISTVVPADAPILQGGWGELNRALVVLMLPAIVYMVFVVGGGQFGAFMSRKDIERETCPTCGEGTGIPGRPCSACGQFIPRLNHS
jgi:hypothetical protein